MESCQIPFIINIAGGMEREMGDEGGREVAKRVRERESKLTSRDWRLDKKADEVRAAPAVLSSRTKRTSRRTEGLNTGFAFSSTLFFDLIPIDSKAFSYLPPAPSVSSFPGRTMLSKEGK